MRRPLNQQDRSIQYSIHLPYPRLSQLREVTQILYHTTRAQPVSQVGISPEAVFSRRCGTWFICRTHVMEGMTVGEMIGSDANAAVEVERGLG